MYDELKTRAIDLGKTASASDIIYDALRDQIISGNLKAGESIRQEYIAKLFNVSRIPVREALKRLESQGLIKNVRYKGAIVSSLSKDEITEIFEIRLMLEPLVIKHAVKNMTQETLELAQDYCTEFSEETDSGKWGMQNRNFHETLYRDSKRPFHLKIIREISDRIDSYVRAQLVLTDGMSLARIEHSAILEACVARDAERAAELTRAHIQGAYTTLMEIIDKPAAKLD